MDYKKKYEQAFERARELHDGDTATIVTRTFLEQCFPELKESEDERIMKAIIQLIYKVYANTNYLTCEE